MCFYLAGSYKHLLTWKKIFFKILFKNLIFTFIWEKKTSQYASYIFFFLIGWLIFVLFFITLMLVSCGLRSCLCFYWNCDITQSAWPITDGSIQKYNFTHTPREITNFAVSLSFYLFVAEEWNQDAICITYFVGNKTTKN